MQFAGWVNFVQVNSIEFISYFCIVSIAISVQEKYNNFKKFYEPNDVLCVENRTQTKKLL